MKRLTKVLDTTLSVVSVICTLGFIISVLIQVFSRAFLPRIPAWTEEVSRYLFIYSIAFAGGLVVRRNEYVMVDIITSRFSKKWQRIQRIVVYVILLVFNVYLLAKCVPQFVFIKFRMVSTALEIPMQFIYFSMVVFFGLQALTYVIQLVLELTGHAEPIKEVAT